MDTIQIIILAIIQGLTEFLPVSSSGHLILVKEFSTSSAGQGQAFDVALHIGTAIAVVFYFRKDLFNILSGWIKSLQTKQQTQESTLGWGIIIGTIPACVFGLFIKVFFDEKLQHPLIIPFTLIIFGILLGWASIYGKNNKKDISELSIKDALIIGCAQALALIPGTSRSGVTITTAMFKGFSPVAAARFSFLLSVPAIFMAGGLHIIKFITSSDKVNWGEMGLGMVVSAIVALACIHYFLKLIQKINMIPFVIYRVILGAILIFVFAGQATPKADAQKNVSELSEIIKTGHKKTAILHKSVILQAKGNNVTVL